jgi:UDP-GlcNAc3NAcA epimerase
MMDATIDAVKRAEKESHILATLGLAPRTYALATLHRAENTEDKIRFAALMAWLEAEGTKQPIIMPVHPRTQKIMTALPQPPKNLRLIEPLGYLDMAWLIHHAKAVFTDSGGLQKEAYFHRVPCVTLREETEWVETVEAGWNRLWNIPDYKPRREIADYGAGDASAKIATAIKTFLAAA